MTTAKMIITSAGNSRSIAAVTAETIAAAIKMIIIGSVNCSNSRRARDFFLPSSSLFLPFSASLFSASAEVSPLGELLTSLKTSSADCRYCFMVIPPENSDLCLVPVEKKDPRRTTKPAEGLAT